MTLILQHGAVRAGLTGILLNAPHCEPERAALVAAWLNGLDAGTDVGLYGCGGLAKALASGHEEALQRHRVRFFSSSAAHEGAFSGWPRLTLDELRRKPPQKVALLSHAFAWEMLAALDWLERQRIHTLAELAAAAPDNVFQPLLSGLAKRAEGLRDHLAAKRKPGRPTLALLHPNLSQNAAQVYATMREGGFSTFLLTLNQNAPAMNGAGLDALITASTPDELLLLTHELALGGPGAEPPFEVLLADTGAHNPYFLSRVAQAGRVRLALWSDCYLDTLLPDPEVAAAWLAGTGLDAAAYGACLVNLFTAADLLLIKDDPEHLRARYGISPERVLPGFPHMDGAACARAVRARPGVDRKRLRLVYAAALYKSGVKTLWQDYPFLLDCFRTLTAQGLDLTVYNAADENGLGFEDLRELDAANPLFHYRQRLPREALAEELRGYDLGLLDYGPAVARRFPDYVRTNLQLKIFTYAQAGVPSLTVPDIAFCHRFVAEHGLGLGVDIADFCRLGEILSGFDFDACKPALERFGHAHDLAAQVGGLVYALHRIMLGEPLK